MLETARLRLEPWTEDATDVVVRLSAMPEMTRFVNRGEVWTPERAAEVSARQAAHWERHGFGWHLAVEHETGQPVGFIALNFTDDTTVGLPAGDHEIGWWIDPEYQRRGFASEGAAALRDHAFSELGAPSLVARLQPENLASARTAESIGMKFECETTTGDGLPTALYRLAPGAIA
jgi:RimJ/RimL family protein N-acetyltransferase